MDVIEGNNVYALLRGQIQNIQLLIREHEHRKLGSFIHDRCRNRNLQLFHLFVGLSDAHTLNETLVAHLAIPRKQRVQQNGLLLDYVVDVHYVLVREIERADHYLKIPFNAVIRV